MTLPAGSRLGRYEIRGLLGKGGMGEVYLAHDPQLGRPVALKILPPEVASDAERMRRFVLEAKAASALNHPGILTIYEIGEADSTRFIAAEQVDGVTLRQRMGRGPLALPQALDIAAQVASALAAAHAAGVVHRDVKPGNVMLRPDGWVKLLDFGLARIAPVEVPTESPTQTGPMTEAGVVMGTARYMSPEQACGQRVDVRTDVWSLGVVLYEMVTGRLPFEGATTGEVLSELLQGTEPPPLARFAPEAPDELQRILSRALAKNREERYHSVQDLALDLKELRQKLDFEAKRRRETPSGQTPAPVPAGRAAPSASQALQSLIATCLAKRPEERFASTRQLAAALESLGTGPSAAFEAPTTTQVAPPPEAARSRSLKRAVLVLGAALVLALAATAWIRSRASRSAIASLAVLPFENASKDPDAEYLGDGLTESLIDQMSRVPSLRVMARATVFRFKGATDPQEVGRKLGVGAVLTGSVSRRGDQLSISAELVAVSTGARLWGDRYDRAFADLLHVQDRIASDISDGLRLRLSGQQKRSLSLHGSENPEAYQLYLKARAFLGRDTEEDDLEARRLLLQALEKDPRFVEAHMAVAGTYIRSRSTPPAEAWARAEEEIGKVLDLDPSNVLARCSRANHRFLYDWDWSHAEKEFRELSTDPRVLSGNQYHAIAMFFWARGRPEDSVALMERALRVDPGNLEARIMMADFLAQAGRLEEAISHYTAIARDEPADASPLFGLADVLRRRGGLPGAIDALRKAYELSGEEKGAKALATARTEKDYEDAEVAVARSRLADLEALAKQRYVSPLDLARLQAQVGEREKAFASLEAALTERPPGLVFLKVDRAWDRIRDDARFAALVRRVGIP